MPDIKLELRRENLSIRDVFERNKHSFPVLIQVTQGHHGDIDMDTYSTGHLMRVHTFSKQKRVVATDPHGRHLSIPLSYKVKFRVNKHSKLGKEHTLWEIIQTNTLPVRVELCTPPPGFSLHIGQNVKNVETFGVLNLLETYEETYLMANTIVDGTLDDEVLYVPIYLKSIVVATVAGIEGKPLTEFEAFLDKLESLSACIHYDATGGNNDIAVYSPGSVSMASENIYDYIEPQHFIKYRPTYDKRRPSAPTLNVKELLQHIEKRGQDTQSSAVQGPSRGVNPPASMPESSMQGNIYSDPFIMTDPSPPPPIPARPVTKPKECIQKPPTNHEYVNDVARATVKPYAKAPDASSTHSASSQRKSSEDASSSNFVQGMSISELGSQLANLNLSKYIDAFKEAQINGDLLLDLGEDILREDFDMKRFEAVKLMKFARTGYIPQ